MHLHTAGLVTEHIICSW